LFNIKQTGLVIT